MKADKGLKIPLTLSPWSMLMPEAGKEGSHSGDYSAGDVLGNASEFYPDSANSWRTNAYL